MAKIDADLLYRQIAARIKAARKSEDGVARLTQDQLAKSIDVSRTTITNIETCAQYPTVLQLYAISSALNVPIVDLLPAVLDVTQRPIEGTAISMSPKTAEVVRRLRRPTS